MHKARILLKKPLEKTFLDFKKWVKSIKTAGYNGACTVFTFIAANPKEYHRSQSSSNHFYKQSLVVEYTKPATLKSTLQYKLNYK